MSEKHDTYNGRSYNEKRRIESRQNSVGRTRATRTRYSERTRDAKGVRVAQNGTKKVVRLNGGSSNRSASERSRKATVRRKRKNRIVKGFMIVISIFVVISILLCLPIFNINNVTVSGNNMLDVQKINSQLDYLSGMNAFMSNKGSLLQKYCFNFDALEQELMTNNGRIASVKIRYSLGGELKVDIEEATPIAVAEIDEKYYLIDRDWVVMEEYSSNPTEEPKKTAAKKAKKKNNKKIQKKQADANEQLEEQSQEIKVYEEAKDLVIVKGLSREDLCVSRVNTERTGLKSSLLEAAWDFAELSNSPFIQENNKICELEVDNLFVNYVLKRGIKVKMGVFSNFNEEQIMYKAQFLEGILNELPMKSCGTIDMFSSEKPVFIPENKK